MSASWTDTLGSGCGPMITSPFWVWSISPPPVSVMDSVVVTSWVSISSTSFTWFWGLSSFLLYCPVTWFILRDGVLVAPVLSFVANPNTPLFFLVFTKRSLSAATQQLPP
jgi:hypothetical protein